MELNDANKIAGSIAGGIDTKSDTVITGGKEIVVGENTKWNIRDQFLKVKYANNDVKELLKIVGLKLPISFNSTIAYYDDAKKDKQAPPKKKDDQISKTNREKAKELLKQSLDTSIQSTINDMIISNKLQDPLLWTLGDVIKYLAVVHRKKRPNSRRIKISPEMALIIEHIWGGKNYFKYHAFGTEVPQNMIELINHMLDTIQKDRPKQGIWVEPKLIRTTYPVLTAKIKESMEKDIVQIKKELSSKSKVIDYVLAVIKVRKVLSDHINNIEMYYVQNAKNIGKILKSLKKFFS
jgi:hypothetical protein